MSTHYGTSHFSWKDYELYFRNQKTGISIVLFPSVSGRRSLWKIKFPAGTLSDDFYNETRAKDNAKKYEMRRLNMVEEDSI